MVDHMTNQLLRFAKSNGASLFLIPSPRCPEHVLRQLLSDLKSINCYTVDKSQANPYPGILKLADAVIVTSDSVNMASEAASTGKPVMIAYWTTETGRIAKFHQTMQGAGHCLPLAEKLPNHVFVPLNQNDKLRREIDARLAQSL